MIKKLGSKKASKSEANSSWVESIGSQLNNMANMNDVDTRYLEISCIEIDENNPRDLKLQPEDIKNHLETLGLDAIDEDSDWLEEYQNKASEVFSGQKLKELIEIASLARSIRTPEELISPILVFREGEGTKFKIITGERRYLAHLLLKASVIACVIRQVRPQELELRLIQWKENEERKSIGLRDKIINLKQILDAHTAENPKKEMSVRKFANLTGLEKSQSGVYLKVIKEIKPELLERVGEENLASISKVYDAVKADNLVSEPEKNQDDKQEKKIAKTNKNKTTVAAEGRVIKKIIQIVISQLDVENQRTLENLNLDDSKEMKKAFKLIAKLLVDEESHE